MPGKTFKTSDKAIRKLKKEAGASLTKKERAAVNKRLRMSKRLRREKDKNGNTFE